jgi:AsmA family protein
MNSRLKQTARWTGIALGGLLVIFVLALALTDWNLLKPPIERIASTKSGRPVNIAGDLRVHIWSWTPSVTINGLTVGNPPWEASRPMLKVPRVEVRMKLLPLLEGELVLPRVALFGPDLYLHQDRAGRANWTFENQAPTNEPAPSPTKLPVIRDLLIESGTLTLVDELRRLKVKGTIQAHEKASKDDPKPFRIEGKGTMNAQPFELQVAGGPLVNLEPLQAYPFDLGITAGEIQVASSGRVLKPFSLAELDFNVTLSGKDLAEGFYLTQLALPNTPPFKLHAHIARNGNHVGVTDIAGKLGESDVRGKLDIDATRKRPSVSGDLLSNQLRLRDLAASLGHKTQDESSLDAKSGAVAAAAKRGEPKDESPPRDPNERLFPEAHLQVDRVRAMDADVHFRAKAIEAGAIPFKQVALRVKLEDGVLAVSPLTVQMPQGSAKVDARQDVPKVHIDLHMKDIQLDQLKGKAPDATPPLAGIMQARAVVDGIGDSAHRVMSNANGLFTLVLPNGEVRSAFAELTGINVAKGLGLLLTNANEREQIRCGLAQFDIKEGLMNATNVTFDTEHVVIRGKGDINLGSEELNLQIKGDPKKLRLARVRTPIELKGHLMKPSIGVDVGSTVKQGAIAAVLGTIVTPIAAVFAFVDPGLAKDQNCAALLAEQKR